MATNQEVARAGLYLGACGYNVTVRRDLADEMVFIMHHPKWGHHAIMLDADGFIEYEQDVVWSSFRIAVPQADPCIPADPEFMDWLKGMSRGRA